MDIQSSVAAYLARGCKVQRLPGFTGIKPMPVRRNVGSKSAPAKDKTPQAKASRPVIASLTLGQIAHRHGIKIGVLNTMRSEGLLPAPDDFGFNGTRRWTLPLVERIAQLVTEREEEECKRETREILERLRRRSEVESGKAS